MIYMQSLKAIVT